MLLAIDLGLKTGLAAFDRDGRLIWYRSHNFGSSARLKRGARTILREMENLEVVVIEGGGDLVNAWEFEARRLGIDVIQTCAERWRAELMTFKQQRGGKRAKTTANGLARKVIDWSNARKPTALRHDAAEAILIGLWAVLRVGWLDKLPSL